MYSLSFNNYKIDLPKCSLKVQEQIENLVSLDKEVRKGRTKYRVFAEDMYSFVCELLGEDKVREIFSNESLEDIDVKELEILIINIITAYNQKLDDITYKKEFEPVNKIIKDPKVNKLIDLATSNKTS